MRSRKTIATPPGATIREQLEDRGMTQKDFAQRMDMSPKHISRLINGEVHLTPDVALRLQFVLGIPAEFWNNLEARFREKCTIVEAENNLAVDIECAKNYPYNEIAKLGWIEQTNDKTKRVFNLREYFGVASLVSANRFAIAYRRTNVTDKSSYVLAVWTQQARIQARSSNTEPINLAKLKEMIPMIRKMTLEAPAEFSPRLRDMLAQCGIALIYLPHMPGSFLHGATFYDGKRIVMGLTVRGKDADKFWFSLFHEFGHVIEGHIEKEDGPSDDDESSANTYSRDLLIPPVDYEQFIRKDDFTSVSIRHFADRIGIHPGIVVGRLQKENIFGFNMHNDLKQKYMIV